MNLEKELERALARSAPDKGFADRVVARTKSRAKTRPAIWMRVAASLVLVATLGGIELHRRAEGERARREVMLALHIASSKVRVAQREVQHLGHD